MSTRLFYEHDTDSHVMAKKDRVEVNNWTDDLEYVNEELDYLLDIEESVLQSPELFRQLHELRRENQLKLAALYRYESAMGKAIECDTVACDAHYLHNHEKARNLYIDHIKKYRSIKAKTLSKILMVAKR